MSKDPNLQAKIKSLAELEGLTAEDILQKLHQEAEEIILNEEEGPKESQPIPSEIKLISQALAYRPATIEDLDELFTLLNGAYSDETNGPEAFRKGPTIDKKILEQYILDTTYTWCLLEAPSGMNIEQDGAILGACCYSTDGVSRKNGEVEGNVGSIRYFAIIKRYRGLCLGQRLLKKIEETIFLQQQCCKCLVCIPNVTETMCSWIERRGYELVNGIPYPFNGLKQEAIETIIPSETFLLQYVKANPHKITSTNSLPLKELPTKELPAKESPSKTQTTKEKKLSNFLSRMQISDNEIVSIDNNSSHKESVGDSEIDEIQQSVD